jgi:dUTP pyrophosphatase
MDSFTNFGSNNETFKFILEIVSFILAVLLGKKILKPGNKINKIAKSNLIKFTKFCEIAKIPIRATEKSVGLDLFAAEDKLIAVGARSLVRCGVRAEFPSGCYGRVAGRSSQSLSRGLVVGAGVIDPDYSGEISVLLFNFGDEPAGIKGGDRIAQLICEKAIFPEITELISNFTQNDGDTNFQQHHKLQSVPRGENGFGSTGSC